MDTIGQQKIWSFVESKPKAAPTTCVRVRQSDANHVASFMDLAKKVAELQFMNRDFVLLFRGQTGDWKNKAGNTTLKPTIFRADKPGKVPTETQLSLRYDRLRRAEIELVNHYRTGNPRIRSCSVRWHSELSIEH